MSKCRTCKCPTIGATQPHYKGCKHLIECEDARRCRSPTRSLKGIINKQINHEKFYGTHERYWLNSQGYEDRILKLEEVKKVIVEDEVYETIWDCQPVRLAAA